MFQTIGGLVSWVGPMFTWRTWVLGMTLFWPLTQFDLTLTLMYFDLDLILSNINWTFFWPLWKVWPHFWAIMFDLILTYSSLTSFWCMKFDFILTYKSLTSFWPAIIWPHFDLLSLTSFWPIMFDLISPVMFDLIWPVMVWTDFDLQ